MIQCFPERGGEDVAISFTGSPLDLRRTSSTFKALLVNLPSWPNTLSRRLVSLKKVDHKVSGSNPHRFELIFFGRPTALPSSQVLRLPSPRQGGTADLRPSGRGRNFSAAAGRGAVVQSPSLTYLNKNSLFLFFLSIKSLFNLFFF